MKNLNLIISNLFPYMLGALGCIYQFINESEQANHTLTLAILITLLQIRNKFYD